MRKLTYALPIRAFALLLVLVPMLTFQTAHASSQTSCSSGNSFIKQIEVTLLSYCCGKRLNKHQQQNCEVSVQTTYCRTQIINNTPITYCWRQKSKAFGVFHPEQGCCEVKVAGMIVCARPGTTISVGPIYTQMNMSSSEEVAPPPPMNLIESYEGSKKTIRYVPTETNDSGQPDLHMFSGNRLIR